MTEFRHGLSYQQAERLRAENPGKYVYVRTYVRRSGAWTQTKNTYGLQLINGPLLGDTLVINLAPEEAEAIEMLLGGDGTGH